MLDLKGIYIYLLSLQKITTKYVREFFFSTSFYNKILLSEIPSRFFFYPNPHLLSPLLNHKDSLIKLSKFEANLQMTLAPRAYEDVSGATSPTYNYNIYFYAVSYNIFRVIGGMANMEFSN